MYAMWYNLHPSVIFIITEETTMKINRVSLFNMVKPSHISIDFIIMKKSRPERNCMTILGIVRPFLISQVFIIMKEKPHEFIQYGVVLAYFYRLHYHDSNHTGENDYEYKKCRRAFLV